MTFAELSLYQAVYRVFGRLEKPGSEDWNLQRNKELYKLVLFELVDMGGYTEQGIPYSLERVVEVWRDIRKNLKNRLKCEVSLIHGGRCFYAHRGVGDCAEEVELDRIVPETRGGQYTVENCVIACTRHNAARGNRSIEDYLTSAVQNTEGAAR
jgi:hypothetical protein